MGKGLPHIYISCCLSPITRVSSEALPVSICFSAVIMIDVRLHRVSSALLRARKCEKRHGGQKGRRKGDRRGLTRCAKLSSFFLFDLPVLCA